MNRDDFAETIACLMRVAWAAAAGRIHLAGGRQRLSSQSSDDDGGGGSDSDSLKSFRSSISSNTLEVTNKVRNCKTMFFTLKLQFVRSSAVSLESLRRDIIEEKQ